MSRWARIAVVVSLLTGGSLLAQRGGSPNGPRPGFGAGSHGPGLTILFHANPTGSSQHLAAFPQAFFSSPFFYSYYFYPTIPAQVGASQPQVILVQPAPEKPDREAQDEKLPQMLLLERRGNRFVQVGASGDEENVQTANNEPSRLSQRPLRSERLAYPHVNLPPAVLVFRDGHREEIDNYTIIGDVLYESSDYWRTGTWTKRVLLTSLNLPLTMQENRARGSKFLLPTGPHEIVVRP
jgi:hypothetical protein